MLFRIEKDFDYEHQQGQLKIAGKKYNACIDKDWSPKKSERLGNIKTSGKGKVKGDDANYLQLDDDKEIVVLPYDSKSHLFTKKKGWIKVESEEQSGYLKVTGTRILPIIALIILALVIIILVYSLLNGVNPKDAPAYFADQTGIINNDNQQPTAHVSYATYQSTPDQTWKANTLEQDITLALPENVTYTDTDGQQKTEKNPVVAAPSIWVDLNNDGDFSNDECVFNPPTYDKDGTVTHAGNLLDPGKQITHITLTKKIPAGTYKAQTLWTPQMAEGGSPANPMTFNWNLTVN